MLINDFYQTNIPGIYAIGDIVKGPALAHVASAEGICCVEKIAGMHVEPINYGNIPGCTYCSPEIASVGMTEKAAKEAGYEIKVGKFPFSASGKAQVEQHRRRLLPTSVVGRASEAQAQAPRRRCGAIIILGNKV